MGDTTNTTEKTQVKEDKPKTSKKSWFKGLKAEFKKIIWPDKEALAKQSLAVVVVSICLGLIIALVDMVIKAGINVII